MLKDNLKLIIILFVFILIGLLTYRNLFEEFTDSDIVADLSASYKVDNMNMKNLTVTRNAILNGDTTIEKLLINTENKNPPIMMKKFTQDTTSVSGSAPLIYLTNMSASEYPAYAIGGASRVEGTTTHPKIIFEKHSDGNWIFKTAFASLIFPKWEIDVVFFHKSIAKSE